jgi:oxalate decarboxylase/phosphoglucose isomerase-like protein (cupin superfamily)
VGADAAFLNLDGAELINGGYLLDLRPGVKTNRIRGLFEEIVYVVEGFGSTTIRDGRGESRSFEWRTGSLFAIPLNTWREHANPSTSQHARFFSVHTMPLVMNLYQNMDFIFNSDYDFTDRFSGQDEFFSSKGTMHPGRIWETNFIPDVLVSALKPWPERGAGGTSLHFSFPGNTTHAHVSEFPSGTYKKAHRHGPGAHVIILSGEGYSLMWAEGREKQKFPWRPGSVICPPGNWYHQHFNTGPESARYLAITLGSLLFGHSKEGRRTHRGDRVADQIEYENEDPGVRKLFERELAIRGVLSRQPG